MINLYELTRPELDSLLTSWQQPRFRAGQVWSWLYDKLAADFESMTDLPESLRRQLSDTCTLGVLHIAAERASSDGTAKRVYELPDGQLIESVLMPYDDDRRTACISTQAGCAVGAPVGTQQLC